jgi:hypothetical protein
VADALGMDNNLVAKGLGAAMPAVLAGVLGAASKPEGQAMLGEALDAADPSLLDNLGGLLSGGGSASMIATGSKLLSGFMGDSSLGQLAGALGSSLGAPKESTGSLLGLAAPMLMGMLAGKKKSEGMDVGGLVSSLMGQKELIAKAIPDDVTRELAGTGAFGGLLDSVGGGAAEAVSEAAEAAASAAAASAERAADTAVKAAADTSQAVAESSSSWLKWIIIAAVILGLLYFLSGMLGKDSGTADRASAVSAEDFMVGGVNVGDLTEGLVGDLGDTLAGITDVQSARAALSDLDNIGQQLGTIEQAIAGLTPAGKSALGNMVKGAMPAISEAADRLLGDSSIAAVIKPSLDSLMSRLANLAG